MTSKQEKLAAARRKLKEFQGKHKETDVLKRRSSSDFSTPTITKDSSNEYVINNRPLKCERESIQNTPQATQPYYQRQHVIQQMSEDNSKMSESSLNGSNPEYHYPSASETKHLFAEKSDCANGLTTDFVESHDVETNYCIKSSSNNTSVEGNAFLLLSGNEGHADVTSFNDAIKLETMEVKDLFNDETNSRSSVNDVVKPLQMELQNHAQTIAILVQQRNDAQTALVEAQTLLNEKSEEVKEVQQQVVHLTSSTRNLSQRLSDAESVIMKLKLEKEDNMQKQEEVKSLAEKCQAQLCEKEEELEEMRRKHKDKNSECQKLLFSLQEAQSQLSLYQIQLQQYTAEGHSNLASQVSELQNNNMSLKEKILELEKKLEAENVEKEEASQKFHIYAQQCNSQITFLNNQLKSLKTENENLSQENKILSGNLSELEKSKEKEFTPESFESEIANLHSQLSALSEKNNELSSSLKMKEEECAGLEGKLNEKELVLNRLLGELKELEEENKTLANEAETPKANERLLATMESDKIAAAKAVSQNHKLKEQVLELENAFMKISEEKLDLTNQLAHEKHVNTELQNLLKNAESKNEDHGDEHHHHHHHHHHEGHDCHHENEKPESLVNDSNEIDELRNIIRQLQDDKMELTTRLNSYEPAKGSHHGEVEKNEKICDHQNEHEDIQCRHTKLLLQQMEEKVKKTMNEIAVLDEEKEKLEHLVLQLQGETETIGEYITLYQKQRMLLRQRAQEKDIQLLQLSKDKEELKSKLSSLDELVQRLIAERENAAAVQPASKGTTANSSTVPENTAGKIRALINEIGSTTLISNQAITFEHCSCCSGRLITI